MKTGKGSRNNPWLFFALAYGWSWLFLIPAVVAGLNADQALTSWLRALSGIGPTLSALVLLYLKGTPQSQRDYWKRLISTRDIGALWWIVILFAPLVFTLIAGGLDGLAGGRGVALEAGLPGGSLVGWAGFVIFIFVFGPLPEEMGWRGYALDGLQDRWNALVSSLILGGAWALWHIPLFFIEGTYQADLGRFTPAFWLFLLQMIPESILITWVYNNTRRSILSAVVFHFAINLTGEIFSSSPMGNWVYFGCWLLAAVLVVLLTGPGRLQRHVPASRNGN